MATEASERKVPVNACCVVNEHGDIHDNADACIILPLFCGNQPDVRCLVCSSLLLLTNLHCLTAFSFSPEFVPQLPDEFTILEFQLITGVESYCCLRSAAASHSNAGDNIRQCRCPSLFGHSCFLSCKPQLLLFCAPSMWCSSGRQSVTP